MFLLLIFVNKLHHIKGRQVSCRQGTMSSSCAAYECTSRAGKYAVSFLRLVSFASRSLTSAQRRIYCNILQLQTLKIENVTVVLDCFEVFTDRPKKNFPVEPKHTVSTSTTTSSKCWLTYHLQVLLSSCQMFGEEGPLTSTLLCALTC